MSYLSSLRDLPVTDTADGSVTNIYDLGITARTRPLFRACADLVGVLSMGGSFRTAGTWAPNC
jgi:hypothetical protein